MLNAIFHMKVAANLLSAFMFHYGQILAKDQVCPWQLYKGVCFAKN